MHQKSSAMRKPYSTAVLKTRPPAQQREIHAYLQGHSYSVTRAWLAEQGIKTGVKALQEFYRWYPTAAPLQAATEMRELVKEIVRESPALVFDERQLLKAAQIVFQAQALSMQDPKLFLSLRRMQQADLSLELKAESAETRARHEDRALALAERRIALLEAKAAEALALAESSRLSEAEKAARMREIFDFLRLHGSKAARRRKVLRLRG